jgi:bacterioferritin
MKGYNGSAILSGKEKSMASKELLDGLNKALAMDLRATIQYMWQHVTARGVEREKVGEVFKDIAMEEMKHAESFGERIHYLGGTPTTIPMEIKTGENIKEMLEVDLASENESIEACKEIIRMAIRENDVVTRTVIENILAETEEHAHKFGKLLG